jgi:2-dehydro-3-deoxygalactonokinase
MATDPAQVDWIAVDWGTSHLRAWAMGETGVLARAESDDGMGGLSRDGFEPALLALVADWLAPDRATHAIACGMVGSRQGWVEAPYLAVPCPPLDPERLARAPCADPRLTVDVIPGLKQVAPVDVMRGEETQIAGFLALQPGFDGVLCLPGTHTKWVRISAGEVVSFQTFMTGEMFALLADHSVLRHSVAAEGWDDAAFAEAVADALSRPDRLAARLFTLRAEGLIAGLSPQTARARLSGALIGAELAAARPYWLGQSVAILGAPVLSQLYATALAAQGLTAAQQPAEEMTLAGLALAHSRKRITA